MFMYNLEMVLYLSSCLIALDYIMRERSNCEKFNFKNYSQNSEKKRKWAKI